MATSNLQEHYERKYSHEEGRRTAERIDLVKSPVNRFEAAVAYFPTHFNGGAILELGAGNGSVAATLLGMDLGIESYTLGDISVPRVSGIAKTVLDDRISARHLDAERLSIDELGKFDAVIMIALIEHLIDPIRAMQNIRKLLKPGGFVYIDTPNIAKYTRRAQLLFGRFPSTASMEEGLKTYDGQPVDLHDEGHLHYFTYGSLSRMLIEFCGFSEIVKLSYPCGRLVLGKLTESWLARVWPEAFSELVLIARA